MYKLNGTKINIHAVLTVGKGSDAITYPAASLQNPALRQQLGIIEEADPVRPDDRLFFVTENPDGTFNTVPRDRAQVTAPVWEQIKATRDSVKAGGVLVAGAWFHSDIDSRWQHLALARAADAVQAAGGETDAPLTDPATKQQIQWKTREGSEVPMTCALAYALIAADAALDLSAHAAAETHRVAMEKVDNPFEYDFSQGWPESFDRTGVAV